MKTILPLVFIIITSCCGAKKASNNAVKENTGTSAVVTGDSIPDCLREMIKTFASEVKQNPPRKIYSYTYQGKTVYYVTPPCCDFFSDLYDSGCKLMGHPDGGITGKGDRKFPDFVISRTNEKLIWEDKRK